MVISVLINIWPCWVAVYLHSVHNFNVLNFSLAPQRTQRHQVKYCRCAGEGAHCWCWQDRCSLALYMTRKHWGLSQQLISSRGVVTNVPSPSFTWGGWSHCGDLHQVVFTLWCVCVYVTLWHVSSITSQCLDANECCNNCEGKTKQQFRGMWQLQRIIKLHTHVCTKFCFVSLLCALNLPFLLCTFNKTIIPLFGFHNLNACVLITANHKVQHLHDCFSPVKLGSGKIWQKNTERFWKDKYLNDCKNVFYISVCAWFRFKICFYFHKT